MTAPVTDERPMAVSLPQGQPYTVLVHSASKDIWYAVDWALLADGRFTTECECPWAEFHPGRQCKHGRRVEEVIRATKEFQEMTASPRPQLEVVPPTEDDHARLQKLREPFPENQIDKLPKGGTMLDYVGHAGVTNRLLEVDPLWDWQPLAMDEHGLPLFSRTNAGAPVGLWIKLTVCGVTRLGYGSVAPNAFDAEKQLIGDAIRNAAMRFGVALDLWAKSDLHDAGEQQEAPPARPAARPAPEAQQTSDDPATNWKQLPDLMKQNGLLRADLLPLLDGDFSVGGLASYLDADPAHTLGTLISAAKARKGGE